MKLLIISKSLVVGSYHSKLRELAKLGIELTAMFPDEWGGQKAEIHSAAEYKVIEVPARLSGHNHFHFYKSIPLFQNYDLVHIDEEPFSLVTFQLMKHFQSTRKPILFFTWQNINKKYPLPFRLIEQYTFQRVTGAVAGNWEAECVLREHGFRKQIWRVPQYGVDTSMFYRRDASEIRKRLGLHHCFVIGYMGRLIPEKGILDLIRAIKALPPHCYLVVVGDGQLRRNAEVFAGQIGVGQRVRFVSHVPSIETPNYLSAFDVLVLPSRTASTWKEQFGRVLIEAMACGTPVIGSTSGEIPTVIGNAGLTFSEGSVEELAARLSVLAENAAAAEELSRQGIERVLKHFDQKRIAEAYASIYNEILSSETQNGVSRPISTSNWRSVHCGSA